MLETCGQLGGIHGLEACQRFLHSVLEEKVINHAHAVHGIELRLVCQRGEELRVLLEHRRIREAPLAAEAVGALIDERAVFEVLVGLPFDGINCEQLAVEVRAEVSAIPQKLPQRRRVVVEEGVDGDRLITHMMLLHEGDEFLVEIPLLAAPGHSFEVERLQVILLQKPEHLGLGAVLRDVIPRGFVHLREFGHDVELHRLRRRAADVHGEVRELHARLCRHGGEVEVILKGLRRVRLQTHLFRVGGLAAEDGKRSLRDLQQHGGLDTTARRVRDDHIGAVSHAGEEFGAHILLELLISLHPVAVAMPEEALRDEELALRGLVALHGLDLLVEKNAWSARREGELAVLRLRRVFRRLKRQIEHRQRQHHLREVPMSLRYIRRNKSTLRSRRHPRRIIPPERVHGDEFGSLFGDAQLVIIVLCPLLRRAESAVENAHFLASSACHVFAEVAERAACDDQSASVHGRRTGV